MKHLRWAFVLCLATISCSDPPAAPSDAAPLAVTPTGLRIVGYRPSVARRVAAFTRRFAAAMASDAARAAVHEALRTSPLTEHKVLLSDFLASEEGGVVVRAMAAAGSIPEAEVRALANSLPAIDLYAPAREHRLSWHANEAVAVIPLVDEVSRLFAYTSSGEVVAIDRHSRPSTMSLPMLMLGPHETSFARPDVGMLVASRGSLSVIEDVHEGEIARMQCYEDCGGGGGGSPPPPNNLRLAQITTNGVCDNNFCWEGNEFEIHGRDSYNTEFQRLRCVDVPSSGTYVVQPGHCDEGGIVHSSSPQEVSWIDVWADETDAWPNGDDQFRAFSQQGLPVLVRITDNAQGQTDAGLWHWDGGSWGCGQVATALGYVPACNAEVVLRLAWP